MHQVEIVSILRVHHLIGVYSFNLRNRPRRLACAGILGYTFKYAGNSDFHNFVLNVTADDIKNGRDEYVRLGAGENSFP